MTNKKFLTGGAILVALVAVIGISIASFAAQTEPSQNNTITDNQDLDHLNCPMANSGKGPGIMHKEKAENSAISQALESGDYQDWIKAVGENSNLAQQITQEEFPRLVEAYKLKQEAKTKFDQARQIEIEIGFMPQSPAQKAAQEGIQN